MQDKKIFTLWRWSFWLDRLRKLSVYVSRLYVTKNERININGHGKLKSKTEKNNVLPQNEIKSDHHDQVWKSQNGYQYPRKNLLLVFFAKSVIYLTKFLLTYERLPTERFVLFLSHFGFLVGLSFWSENGPVPETFLFFFALEAPRCTWLRICWIQKCSILETLSTLISMKFTQQKNYQQASKQKQSKLSFVLGRQ